MLAERVLALATLLGGGLFLTQALAVPYGSAARPGAGFFPTLVAVFACAVGFVATVRAFLVAPRTAGQRATPLEAEPRARVLVAVVLLLAFCAFVPWIGYPLAAAAFVALLLRRLGASWQASALTAVLSAAGSYYLFAFLLDVPLPRGPW